MTKMSSSSFHWVKPSNFKIRTNYETVENASAWSAAAARAGVG